MNGGFLSRHFTEYWGELDRTRYVLSRSTSFPRIHPTFDPALLNLALLIQNLLLLNIRAQLIPLLRL